MTDTRALVTTVFFKYLDAGEKAFIKGATKMGDVVRDMTTKIMMNVDKMQNKLLATSQKSLAGIRGTFAHIERLFNSKEQAFEDVMMAAFQMSAIGANIARKSFQLFQGMIGKSVEVAADFEKGMTRLKFVTEASKEELTKLSDETIRLGIATEWMPKEVLDAMEKLGSAGLRTKQILEAIEPVLDFATISAGAVNLEESAKLLVSTLQKFGLETSQSAKVMDVFTETINNALLTAEDTIELVRSMRAVPGVFQQPMEAVMPLAIGLTNVGETAAESGLAVANFGRRIAIIMSMVAGILKRAHSSQIRSLAESINFVDIVTQTGKDGTRQFRKFTDIVILLNRRLKEAFPDAAERSAASVRLLTDIGNTLIKTVDQMEAEIKITTKSSAILREILKEGYTGITKVGDKIRLQGEAVIKYYEKLLERTEGLTKAQAKELLKTWDGIRKLMKGSLETIRIIAGQTLLPTVKILGTVFYEKVIQPLTEFAAKRRAFVYVFQVVAGSLALMTGAAMTLVAIFGTLVSTIWAIGHMFAKKEFTLFWIKTLFPKIVASFKLLSGLTLIWLLDLFKIRTVFYTIGEALRHANKYIEMSHEKFLAAISVFLDAENSAGRITNKMEGIVDVSKKVLSATNRWALAFTKIYLIASSIIQQYKQGYFDYETGRKIIAAGWKEDAEWWYDLTRKIVGFFEGFTKGFLGVYKVMSVIATVAIIVPLKIAIYLWNELMDLIGVGKWKVPEIIGADTVGIIVGAIIGILTLSKAIDIVRFSIESLYKSLVFTKDMLVFIGTKGKEKMISGMIGFVKKLIPIISLMRTGASFMARMYRTWKAYRILFEIEREYLKVILGAEIKSALAKIFKPLIVPTKFIGKGVSKAWKAVWKYLLPKEWGEGYLRISFFHFEKRVRAKIAEVLSRLVGMRIADKVDKILKKHISDRIMRWMERTAKFYEPIRKSIRERGFLGSLKYLGKIIQSNTKAIIANVIAWIKYRIATTRIAISNFIATLSKCFKSLTLWIRTNTKAIIANMLAWISHSAVVLKSTMIRLIQGINLVAIFTKRLIALAGAQMVVLLTNPWTWIAIAIIAAIALIIAYRRELTKVGELTKEFLVEKFEKIVKDVEYISKALEESIVEKFGKIVDDIKYISKAIEEFVVGKFGKIIENIKYIIENFKYFLKGIGITIEEKLPQKAKEERYAPWIGTIISPFITSIKALFEDYFGKLTKGLPSPFVTPFKVETSPPTGRPPEIYFPPPPQRINNITNNYNINITNDNNDKGLVEKLIRAIDRYNLNEANRK